MKTTVSISTSTRQEKYQNIKRVFKILKNVDKSLYEEKNRIIKLN